MVPIWLAIPPALLFAALGAVIDRAARLGLAGGWGQWPRWIACGMTAAFLLYLHPAIAASVGALVFMGRASTGRVTISSARGRSVELAPVLAVVGLALAVVAVLRPPVPMYWDAFVWLGKARIESAGLGSLRSAALDAGADVIPHGYPLLWPLEASWFSMLGTSAAALVAGAAAATMLALLLFLDAAAEAFEGGDAPIAGFDRRPRWAFGGALALLLVTPMCWVHLRSAYADLPVGLLAATCTLRLGRCVEGSEDQRADLTVAVLAATALAGTKDEGIGHVTAIVLATLMTQPKGGRREALRWLSVLGSAAIVFVGWRTLLQARHVVNSDHELSAPAFEALGPLARVVVSSAADTRTWGALWPVAIGATAAVLSRGSSFRPATRLAAYALLGQAGLLAAALVFGPDRVRTFAFEGTLVNRLLLQLAPPVGALLALALGDAASRPVTTGDAGSQAGAVSRSS
jgi:hypothetical protein